MSTPEGPFVKTWQQRALLTVLSAVVPLVGLLVCLFLLSRREAADALLMLLAAVVGAGVWALAIG